MKRAEDFRDAFGPAESGFEAAVRDTLEELQFSSDVIELFKQCNDMFEQSRGNAVSEEQLHKLIDETKKLISANYTEYDDQGMVS